MTPRVVPIKSPNPKRKDRACASVRQVIFLVWLFAFTLNVLSFFRVFDKRKNGKLFSELHNRADFPALTFILFSYLLFNLFSLR